MNTIIPNINDIWSGMAKQLVSIITPCYNTGKLLHRLFDSILRQDYPFVEMYAINDGSTDETEFVIKSYIEKFEQKGYALYYVYQENSGQSAALNNGLKRINGEYLVWPDSDDWYSTSTALSRMVETLQNSDESVSMVRCLAEYVSEETLEAINKTSYTAKTDLFEDCLFAQKGFWYCAGGYMCRVGDLDKFIEGREIYVEKNAGQNWQLMLPLLYDKKCVTINEFHYQILQRSTSHSRGQYGTYEGKIIKQNTYEKTIISTLERMLHLPNDLRVLYIRNIEIKYLLERYYLSLYYLKFRELLKIEEELNVNYGVKVQLRKKIRILVSRFLGI